ncbi:ATP-binding protein [Halobacterium salinarum]|uniref:AAA-4 family protein n=5 Tax=Halobacterium salinarum TaxID=2242 RepID=Q9HNR8_HALSA|nr:ATP-binding protein [Halobacterium salinarum]AAG20152.1 hypothetical protein VNG_1977H [Halobacterium salinarum NRC-1]MBB6089165.1 hypothetical protein [Halobacterium salinarum]MDL0118741.1 ATP-binding protein [Halobacterium salinarum]MDL0124395.1 ATP-binding protein [Halobacterium salinarum]MDL0142705.1 ATP-binding protein [Halobacterium salinarum]
MQERLYPSSVDEWDVETLEGLVEHSVAEDQYLEYKQYLRYPDHREPEPSKSEWRKDIEREFAAFANASGGVILFGMSDDIEYNPIEEPENEIGRHVTPYIKDCTPVPKIEVSNPLQPFSSDSGRILVAVRVYEAERKPISTSDSSFYVRINDQKHPMSREQIESMFIEADRRQQAIRSLEVEIARLRSVYKDQIEGLPDLSNVPPLSAVDESGIRNALQRNTYLFTNEDTESIVVRVMEILDEIASLKRLFEEGTRNMGRVSFRRYGDLNEHIQENLKSKTERLIELFEMLEDQTQISHPGRR